MRMLMAVCLQSETQNNHADRPQKARPQTTTTHLPNSYIQHTIAYNCQTTCRIQSEGAEVIIPLCWAAGPSCIGPLGDEWRCGMPYQRPLDVLKKWVALDVFCAGL